MQNNCQSSSLFWRILEFQWNSAANKLKVDIWDGETWLFWRHPRQKFRQWILNFSRRLCRDLCLPFFHATSIASKCLCRYKRRPLWWAKGQLSPSIRTPRRVDGLANHGICYRSTTPGSWFCFRSFHVAIIRVNGG